jgi:Protein of unknown function (DUF3592)
MALAGLFLVVVSAAGLLLTAWRFDRLRRFDSRAAVAFGRVISVHEAPVSNIDGASTPVGIPIVVPIVRFRTRDGRTVDARYEVGDISGAFAVGQRVRVLYDPADPAKVVVAEVERTAYAVIVVIAVILALLLVTGLLLLTANL